MNSHNILENETRTHLPTKEAALLLGRSINTLHNWACQRRGVKGPIEPMKAYGKLGWATADIRRLLKEGWVKL